MKIIISFVLIAYAWTAHAEMPVIDPQLILQTIAEIKLTQDQLEQLSSEVRRLGNPATYRPLAAQLVEQSLQAKDIGKSWDHLRDAADGLAAMNYTGDGLYRPVGQTIITSDGQTTNRPPADYKKYDAISLATANLEGVMKDTEARRKQSKVDIANTTEQLRTAQTVAETQKLQAVLAAQSADLASIDRERDGALNSVLAQKIENENDAAKQAQARIEERVADFQNPRANWANSSHPAPCRFKSPIHAGLRNSLMGTIDTSFPGFVKACSGLYNLFLPFAFILLLLAFFFEFWGRPPSAYGMLKFILKLFLVVLLIANANSFITSGGQLIQNWVNQNIPARPENVAVRYQQQLAQAQAAPAKEHTFWGTLFSSDWFEAIIYALLTVIGWIAIAIMWFVYAVQRAVLLLCWAVCPLLFPMMAIPPLNAIGTKHILRILAIMLWPVANALSATWTDGLITAAVNQNFLASHSILGSIGYGLQNLLVVTVIAIWIIFSTIAGPALIQRMLVGSAGSAAAISKSADVFVGIGIPAASSSLVNVWNQIRNLSASSSTGGSTSFSPPPSQPPSASPSSGSGNTTAGTSGDPTGDRAVKGILDKLKSP